MTDKTVRWYQSTITKNIIPFTDHFDKLLPQDWIEVEEPVLVPVRKPHKHVSKIWVEIDTHVKNVFYGGVWGDEIFGCRVNASNKEKTDRCNRLFKITVEEIFE